MNKHSEVFKMLVECNNTFSGILLGSTYKKVTKEKDYEPLTDFLLWLDSNYPIHSIGPNFLLNYCTFQYKYYKESEIVKNNTVKATHLLFGTKARERWTNKKESWWHWSQIECEFDAAKALRYISMAIPEQSDEESPVDIYEGIRSQTIEKGDITLCLEYTNLFDQNSGHCKICPFQQECITIKKDNYDTKKGKMRRV